MSEFEKKCMDEMDAAEVVAAAQEADKARAAEHNPTPRMTHDPDGNCYDDKHAYKPPVKRAQLPGEEVFQDGVFMHGKDPIMEMLEKTKGEFERKKKEAEAAQKAALRREARDSMMLGGMCGLGVISLVAAACTGYWIPVAVGLGICLSGAAGILLWRGAVVLR